MVDDYLDSFQILTSDTRYTDLQTLVVKFHWGLKLNIQSQIAIMSFRWPMNTDPEAWYVVAWRINQVQLANEAFQSTLQSMTLVPICFALPWLTPLLIFHSPPITLPLILLRPSLPIPIDVDAVQKTRSLPPQGCYQCREANYLVRDCPYHLDVWRLTVEQKEELIEDLMALKDIVEEKEICSVPEKNFV